MVALLVAMSVAAIWMAAVLPAWRQQTQRQREDDLIFRGEQYARAIMLFQDKNRGALPPSVDVLVDGRYLRKKWKDPITKEDFVLLGSGLAAQPGVLPQTPSLGQSPGRGSQQPNFGQQQQGPPGITGVRSRSPATSIRVYQNQQQYSAWPFDGAVYRARLRPPVPGASQPGGRPGGPGDRGGVPGGQPGRGVGPGGGPVRPGEGPVQGPGRGGAGPPPPGRGRGGN